MLQPHSFLWHYLWLGPHVLQAGLAILIWRRGVGKLFPVFLFYLVCEAIENFTLYALDILPWVSAQVWWSTFCVGVAIEGLLKFTFVLELFLHLVRPRQCLVGLGKWMIAFTAAVLVLLAAWAAVHVPIADEFALGSYARILAQTVYLIQCGLLLFIFLFAAYFHLAWNSWAFGIALGSSISACVHLATWAVFANIGWFGKGYLLDFLNMATYHVCVLIWFYYLLLPLRPRPASAATISETKTDVPSSANIRRLGTRVVPLESWF